MLLFIFPVSLSDFPSRPSSTRVSRIILSKDMSADVRELVKDATDPRRTRVDWVLISEICERAGESYSDAKSIVSALEGVLKRQTPVSIHLGVELAGALVNNCDDEIKKLIFSRSFLGQLSSIISSKNLSPATKRHCHEFIYRWAQEIGNEQDFRYLKMVLNDLGQLSFVREVHNTIEYAEQSEDVNREKEDIDLAIAISISEMQKPREEPKPAMFRVRALYKYDPQDSGDLRLCPGDVIEVYDTSTYTQWWKGRINNNEGFFPSNFVEMIGEEATQVDSSGHLMYKIRVLFDKLNEAEMSNSPSIVRDPDVRRAFLEVTSYKQQLSSKRQSLSRKTEILISYLKTVDEFVDVCAKCVSSRL